MPFEIWNRRYTGSKYKLADWITALIQENCRGASFCDIFAGTVQRAPELFRRLNLEWLYRLLKQPSRIGRMMKLPLFLLIALKTKLFGGKKA